MLLLRLVHLAALVLEDRLWLVPVLVVLRTCASQGSADRPLRIRAQFWRRAVIVRVRQHRGHVVGSISEGHERGLNSLMALSAEVRHAHAIREHLYR